MLTVKKYALRKFVLIGIALFALLLVILFVIRPVLADHLYYFTEDNCDFISLEEDYYSSTRTPDREIYRCWPGNDAFDSLNDAVWDGEACSAVFTCRTNHPDSTYSACGLSAEYGDCPVASGEAEEIPPPPSVWLAHVCEPEDGFSTAEYGSVITIGSDADSKPYGSILYVGTSIDGPWTSVEVGGPSYILTKTQVEILADSLGFADYNDLWVKASDSGIPANLGSMIVDRDAQMDSICNPE